MVPLWRGLGTSLRSESHHGSFGKIKRAITRTDPQWLDSPSRPGVLSGLASAH